MFVSCLWLLSRHPWVGALGDRAGNLFPHHCYFFASHTAAAYPAHLELPLPGQPVDQNKRWAVPTHSGLHPPLQRAAPAPPEGSARPSSLRAAPAPGVCCSRPRGTAPVAGRPPLCGAARDPCEKTGHVDICPRVARYPPPPPTRPRPQPAPAQSPAHGDPLRRGRGAYHETSHPPSWLPSVSLHLAGGD